MKNFYLKTMLMLCAIVLGVGQAWAEDTFEPVYQRGGSATAWSDADLTSWTGNTSATINGGLSQTGTNAGWASTLDLSTIASTSKVSFTATINGGAASGRAGSYDYVTIGGISLHLYGQDQVAKLAVDGVETQLTSYTRGTNYTLTVTIDQANNMASWTVSGGSTGSATDVTTATKVTNVEVGHYRAGKENYATTVVLSAIDVQEAKQTVAMGGYTIKYMCGDEEIQDATKGEGVVGTTVVVPQTPIWVDGTKYIYDSDDSEYYPITADNKATITAQYKEAANYDYTFKSSVGSFVATGSKFEGETASHYVPRYVVDGTTAYILSGIDKTKNNISYERSAVITENNQVVTFTYNEFATNIAFFSEGEDIYDSEYTGAPTRTSMGTAGIINGETVVTTLAPGIYKMFCATHCGNSQSGTTVTFKVGGETVLTQQPAGWLALEYNGAEFTVNTSSDLVITNEGNTAGLDYVLIQKTGDLQPATISKGGYTTFCPISFNVSVPEGVTAYTANVDYTNKKVVLHEVTDGVLVKKEGYILKGTAGETYALPYTDAQVSYSGNNDLCGTEKDEPGINNAYVLGYGQTDGGEYYCFFGPWDNTDPLPAGKAYLNIIGTSAAKLEIVIDDEASAIAGVSAKAVKAQGRAYNLAGQTVSDSFRGIVVKDGKKVIK